MYKLSSLAKEARTNRDRSLAYALSADSALADKVICRYPIQAGRPADLPIDIECVFASNGIYKAVDRISRFRIL